MLLMIKNYKNLDGSFGIETKNSAKFKEISN